MNGIAELKPFLQDAWKKAGFSDLTAIQERTIPLIREGKDIIAESPTGTGKTLAYLLPILEKINPDLKNLQAVVLAPSRELVMQIHEVIQKFTQTVDISSISLIGGADMKRQIEKLKKHPQIAVGTPGRIKELIQAKKLKMHEVKTIVVDEVDQMFQSNQMDPVQDVVKTTLRDRQLLFFSATVSEKAEKTALTMMREPEVIRVNRSELPASAVEHIYFVCERRDKVDVLRRILKMGEVKAIAFVKDAAQLEELASKLNHKGVSVGVLQGEAYKTERETVMKNFRAGKFSLLLTTDLAARGLDIQAVTHVIHMDLPEDVQQYIHRSGRTGRMGAAGTVISIITVNQEGALKKFSQELGQSIEKKELFMGEIVEKRPKLDKPRPRTQGGKTARPSRK
ncbi:DEAD/DEAH box helicase [Ammoniphilus sp. CFH 90114]|uniref:DEAD/DEAH box helicase n=1 Tax=Ammoniphilus sp. CFH 90114 TaxID=2493665 RepID=UPI00100EAC77|nr:DEAD/DEAH box helicase [Ammoniphilus sp. CFH 90114]RXT04910.1 DEAD/DEAH box helicase [Ammoniphilus sp. CFH 90114]